MFVNTSSNQGFTTLLAKNNTLISLTGGTSETILFSAKVDAGKIQANDFLNLFFFFDTTSNANIKNIRFYFHTSPTLGGTQYALFQASTNTLGNGCFIRNIVFQNSLTSQRIVNSTSNLPSVDQQGGITNNAADTIRNNDFSIDQYLIISGQLTSGTDTLDIKQLRLQQFR